VATELMDNEARGQLVRRHLQLAMVSLVVTIFGGAALGLVLGQLGYNPDLCMLAAWLINLNTARHLGRAAQLQGRSAWLHGVAAAIWPAIAMGVLGYLSLRAILPRAK
jgi:hypothetical protein